MNKKINFKFYLAIIMMGIVLGFYRFTYNTITNKYDFFKSGYFNYVLDSYETLLAQSLFGNQDIKKPTLDTLTSEEIQNAKDDYINQLTQDYTNTKNDDVSYEYGYDEDLKGLMEDKKQKELDKITSEIDATINGENDDKIKKKALESALSYYKDSTSEKTRAEKIIKEITYFKYYYEENGDVYTNLNSNDLDTEKINALNVVTSNKSEIVSMNGDSSMDSTEVYILTPRDGIDTTGKFNQNMIEYNNIKNIYMRGISLLTIASILGLAYLSIGEIRGKNKLLKGSEIEFLAYRVPTDILLIGFLIAVFCQFIIKLEFKYIGGIDDYSSEVIGAGLLVKDYFVPNLIFSIIFFAILLPIVRLVLDCKNDKKKLKDVIGRSIIIKFIKNTRDAINSKTLKKSIVIKLLIFMSIVVITLMMALDDGIGTLLLVVFLWMFLTLIFLLKWFVSFEKIIRGVKSIARGESSSVITIKRGRVLKELADDINNIGQGIKTAVEKETKSERLRTELITNVSHDLKTPLTSIISYIDLLKQGDISEKERKAFIEIIDRKAQGLKMLIEDLFDITKMSSGNVTLTKTRSDIVMLLNQTIGEFNDKIETSGLNFKFDIPDKEIYLDIDGKKIWRVFQNLIINVLKYSQNGTRVYIILKDFEDKIEFQVKNISSYEMNFEADELFERFKRGDASRSAEGTGLGLAIAQSIVSLHQGNLEIKIDGDLFKVIMTLKK